jgi:soluble lytic murein transglycosylase-like protein
MTSTLRLALAGAVLLAAIWWQQRQASAAAAAQDSTSGTIDTSGGIDLTATWAEIENGIYDTTGLSMGGGGFLEALNTRGAPYRALFTQAEQANGLPPLMLARLAYQESRFRADIISGAKVSSAGAVGIMQIVPRWHPDVNPLDPAAAINYAGRYLRQLYNQFGTWELALDAYNWGPGNLSGYLAGNGSTMPAETANYSSQILADIGSNYA